MVGYITKAVADAIRKWPALKDADIIPVFATDGSSVVVNTPLPAVVIHVLGEDGEGNVFLGGGIRQYFELQLYCLFPITNYTFSPDNDAQSKLLDLSDEVIRCVERSTVLENVKLVHDLNLQFDRMETDSTYASAGATSVSVDIHRVIYKGSVRFDEYVGAPDPPIDTILETVNIENV